MPTSLPHRTLDYDRGVQRESIHPVFIPRERDVRVRDGLEFLYSAFLITEPR